MAYGTESEMYPAVCRWLEGFLSTRYKGATIDVFDTSRKSLARLIQETGFINNLRSEWPSWDIYIDIVGFARTETSTTIALVECKNLALTLSHLSQTIGYSRIVLPAYSVLLSPQGCSDSLRSLLETFGRGDVLQYHSEKGRIASSIAVATWNEPSETIELSTVIAGNDNTWR